MVYVDNFYDTGVKYRGMKMCHMIADSTEELLEMVDKIGVQRKWIQHPGTCNEHFDICFSKRQKAVKLGAQSISGSFQYDYILIEFLFWTIRIKRHYETTPDTEA